MLSLTTSNAVCIHYPHAPGGLRSRGASCGVAAPPRWTPSQSSQRLAVDPTAPVTQLHGYLGRAPSHDMKSEPER